jgi:hypothetical protein
MIVTGKVHEVCEMQTGTSKAGNEWTRQNVVIDTSDEYNPHVCISFLGDKCQLLKQLSIGQNVSIHINLSSKKWNDKWFTNVNGWKIDSQETEVEPANDDVFAQNNDDAPF